MAFFSVTATHGPKVLINSNMVYKIVDSGNSRAIYLGNDKDFLAVKESFSTIFDDLKSK